MRKSVQALLASAFLVAAGSLCHAEQIDNPQYVKWSKFKAGTSVTTATESAMAGTTTKMTSTTTLVDISADKAVVEIKTSMNVGGQNMDMPAQKSDVPAKIEKPAATGTPTAAPDVKESSEDIDVAGKKITCKVIETTSTANGMTIHSKTWLSDQIPGGTAKMESTTDGAMKGSTNITVTAMDIK